MRRLSYFLFLLVLGLSGCDGPPGDRIQTEEQTAQQPLLTEEEVAERLIKEAREAAIQAVDSINQAAAFEPATPPEPLTLPKAPVVPSDGR